MRRDPRDPVRNNSRTHNMRSWASDEDEAVIANVRKRIPLGAWTTFDKLKSGDIFMLDGSEEVLQAHPGFKDSPGTYGAYRGNKYRDIGDLTTAVLHIPKV